MKRSQINAIIEDTIAFARGRGLAFPPFAYWSVEDWQNAGPESREIVDNMLGWDISDFGSGDFDKVGLAIFTFRNGSFSDKQRYPKPYAEKLLLVGDGQVLPCHFHFSKMEDIINRGGGNLLIELHSSTPEGEFADSDVTVTMDGTRVTVPAGGVVTLRPGQSVTLLPGQYHRWVGQIGTGKVMLFEVSSTNDDNVDNRFYEKVGRLPEIEEDEPPRHLLFKDYKNYVSF